MSANIPDDVDLAFDDDELLHAVHALVAGDIEPALAFLAATRDQPYRRELGLYSLGYAGSPVLPVLLEAEEERPGDANVVLLLGSAQAAAAWQARGSATMDYTSEEQVQGLINFTRRARKTLLWAAELDPDDVAPWAALMVPALGAPTHRDEIVEVYEEVVKRVPDLVGATLRRLQSVCGKWYGSNEEMFAFARTKTEGLPDGHPLLALIPMAHIERHLDVISSGGIPARLWKVFFSRYLKKQRVEINAASDRLLAGADDHPHSISAHQIFAMYYHKANVGKDRERFAQHIARSGERAKPWPWGYDGDHQEVFDRARRRATAK